jgi:uncharacterized membrane protein
MENINKQHKESLSITEKIASVITTAVGTFTCFIIFTLLACFSLPAVIASDSTIIWVQWITQTFLQLVLLPLIMVGQNLQSRHSEMRAEEDFRVNVKAEKEIETIIKKLDIIITNQ